MQRQIQKTTPISMHYGHIIYELQERNEGNSNAEEKLRARQQVEHIHCWKIDFCWEECANLGIFDLGAKYFVSRLASLGLK